MTTGSETFRAQCRRGEWTGPTCGLAPGYAQANLVILPRAHADDFAAFCRGNPGSCPLIERTDPGVFAPRCAPGADLRVDLPRYRVFEGGRCVARPYTVESYCDAGSTSFLLGCSFSFESALLAAGLPVRHLELGCNVPMYRTHIECTPAGVFDGPLIVSMRPMTPAQAREAARITARFTAAHGAPLHIGDPSALGIEDLDRPDYGDPVPVREGEVPVYWACGVTPMAAAMASGIDRFITHEPGHMFVTDLDDGPPAEDAGD